MNRGSNILILCTTLCLGAALVAQESTPDSKGEPAPQQTPTQQPQAPLRVRVSQGVTQGLIVTKVQPEYPKKARKKKVQGAVLLRIFITPEGDVREVTLVSGDPLLAPAAIDAVKQWKYRPYLLQGRPVEVESQVQVNFTLSSN